MSNAPANAIGKKKFDVKYWIYTIIGLLFMFGFGMLPPIAPLTPVGMKVLGLFISVLFLWSTVGLAWLAGLHGYHHAGCQRLLHGHRGHLSQPG